MSAAAASARRKAAIVSRTRGRSYTERRRVIGTSALGGPSVLFTKVSKTARKSGAQK